MAIQVPATWTGAGQVSADLSAHGVAAPQLRLRGCSRFSGQLSFCQLSFCQLSFCQLRFERNAQLPKVFKVRLSARELMRICRSASCSAVTTSSRFVPRYGSASEATRSR